MTKRQAQNVAAALRGPAGGESVQVIEAFQTTPGWNFENERWGVGVQLRADPESYFLVIAEGSVTLRKGHLTDYDVREGRLYENQESFSWPIYHEVDQGGTDEE